MPVIVAAVVQKNDRFWFSTTPDLRKDFPYAVMRVDELIEDTACRLMMEREGVVVQPVSVLGTEKKGENTVHFQLCVCVSEGDAERKSAAQRGQWMNVSDIFELKNDNLLADVAQYMKAFKGAEQKQTYGFG